jgi:hypothetical protein
MHFRLHYHLPDITPEILALKRITPISHRIYNAGVGGSSPPVTTISVYRNLNLN